MGPLLYTRSVEQNVVTWHITVFSCALVGFIATVKHERVVMKYLELTIGHIHLIMTLKNRTSNLKISPV